MMKKLRIAVTTFALAGLTSMPVNANILDDSTTSGMFQSGEKGMLVLIATLGIMWVLFLVSLECSEHPISNWLNVFSAFFLPISEDVFITAGICQVADRYIGLAWLIPILILIFNTSCMLIAVQKNRVRQVASLISLSISSISMVGLFVIACIVPYWTQALTQFIG